MSSPTASRLLMDAPSFALSGVALIQLLVGWHVYATFGWEALNLPIRLFTLAGFAYLALAFVARVAPLTASLLGAAIFLVYLGLQAATDIRLLGGALIHKIPVALLLLFAVVMALKRRKPREAPPAAAAGQ